MQTLYPDAFGDTDYKIIVLKNKTGDSSYEYKAILYAEATSAQATRMTNLLATFENA